MTVTAEHVKALVRRHIEGDDDGFYSIALQLAARAAREGKSRIAQDLRELIDSAKTPTAATQLRPTPIAQPRGELAGLMSVTYPDVPLDAMTLTPRVKRYAQPPDVGISTSLGRSAERSIGGYVALAAPGKVVGKFGVGLTDALATIDRRGVGVRIRSRFGDITTAKQARHYFGDIRTLHAVITEQSDPEMAGTDAELTGVADGDVEARYGA